jgi:uncharacterized membrane protein
MPFCRNCGSPVEGQFCAKCGTPISAGGASAPPPPEPPPAQPYSQSAGAPPPPPPPAQPYAQAGYGAAPQPAQAASGMTDNLAGLLCYLVGIITGILFLVLEPYNKSKFVRFHAFQSIFLFVAWIALWIVLAILGTIVRLVLGFWTAAALMSGLHLLVGLGFFVLWIVLMVKAYQGQKFMLPIIGPIADKQA